MAKIATIKGVFLAPGRSLNGNLYTPENIADAVTRMKVSIASGTGPPVSQLPEHWTDNVLLTVGQVTDCGQNPDGSAWYEAAVPNTSAGRDLATLTNTENGPAYVRCVSIAAFWEGDIEEIEIDGEWSVTAPGLNVRRIDYVPDPGVVQAHISSSVFGEAAAGTWRDAFEGVEMTVTKDSARKTGFRPAHADPGFLTDGKPRLPLTTTREIREAWSKLNHEGHGYAPGDLARARARVKQAAKDLDVPLDAAPSVGNPEPVQTMDDVKGKLGTLTTEVRAGLVPIDPDQDGDIDGYACPTCGSILPETDPALNPDGEAESKEPAMTETAKPAEGAKPATTETPAPATASLSAASLSEAQLTRLAEILRDKPAGAEATITVATEGSTSPQTPINVEALMERLNQTLDERDKQIAQDLIEAFGPPRRRGLVSGDSTEGTPVHKLSPEQWRARKARMAEAFLPTPATPTE